MKTKPKPKRANVEYLLPVFLHLLYSTNYYVTLKNMYDDEKWTLALKKLKINQ